MVFEGRCAGNEGVMAGEHWTDCPFPFLFFVLFWILRVARGQRKSWASMERGESILITVAYIIFRAVKSQGREWLSWC